MDPRRIHLKRRSRLIDHRPMTHAFVNHSNPKDITEIRGNCTNCGKKALLTVSFEVHLFRHAVRRGVTTAVRSRGPRISSFFLPFSLLFFYSSLSPSLSLSFSLASSNLLVPSVSLTPFASTFGDSRYVTPFPSLRGKIKDRKAGCTKKKGSTLHSQITIGRHRWNINMDTGLGGWLPQPAVVAGQLACQLACCPVL